MESYKDKAANRSIDPSIQTRSLKDLENLSGNLYKSIVVVSRRADQLNVKLKEELMGKLNEFASTNDPLEEVLENKEQIEISKFYERMPKPFTVAMTEFMEENTFYRTKDEDKKV